jgi:hypothetical protein
MSTDAEKALDRIQNPFMTKKKKKKLPLSILGTKNFLSLIKNILPNPTANSMSYSWGETGRFPSKRRSPLTTPFQHHTGSAN